MDFRTAKSLLTKTEVATLIATALIASGELVELFGWLCLVWIFPVLALGFICLVNFVRALKPFSPSTLWRRAVTLFVTFGLVFWSGRIVFGAPTWVRWRAQPLIAAAEKWKVEHGAFPAGDSLGDEAGFPEEMRATARKVRCFYSNRGGDPVVTCSGVLFTHCSYEMQTAAWYGWN